MFALFAVAQGEALSGLAPVLRDALLRAQFAGQTATYRATNPGARFEVVELEDEPVGRVVSSAGAEAVTLLDLTVAPDRRGRGVGTAVLRGLQHEARAAGVPLRLSVLSTNAGARRLYARLGFAPAGDTDTHLHLQWTP